MSTTKKYWKGLEELENSPEFEAKKHNEFPEELPIDAFLGDDKLKESSTSRRDFLKFLGFSVTAATLAACEAPVIKSIPYVNKPEEITPGVANWYASSYYDGNDFASILVKTREGRPIFIKGNPQFGINKGSINARITASVLSLYDSARLKGPLENGAPAAWSKAGKTDGIDDKIAAKLQEIASRKGQIRIVSSTVISPSMQSVISDMITKLNGGTVNSPAVVAINNPAGDTIVAQPVAMEMDQVAPVEGATPAVEVTTALSNIRHIQYDAVSYSGIREANWENFKMKVIPDYDFSKAKTIVSIAADFLGGWLCSNEYVKAYAQNRKPENDWMSKHFQFESIMSISGSNADVRVPIKPSQEGMIAAAILQQIGGDKVGNVPGDILKLTEAAANELKASAGSSLVVAGSNDAKVQMLVNAINEKLGNYNSTINLNNPVNLFMGNDKEVEMLVKEVVGGKSILDWSGTTGPKVEAVIFFDTNPVYTLPNGKEFGEALAKVDLTVSCSGYNDETASKCKFVAPSHNYLESWNDFNPKGMSYAIAQPVIRPLYDTRDTAESLLVWAGVTSRGGDKNSDKWYRMIRKNWEVYGFPMQNQVGTFEEYWNWNVHNGAADMPGKPASAPAAIDKSKLALPEINGGKDSAAGFELVVYQNAAMGIGNMTNNAWLMEMPDPVTKVAWDNYLTMSPKDMAEKGFNTRIGQEWPANVVTIKAGNVEMELPVYPQPGQTSGTIGLALGYGRSGKPEHIGKSAFQYEQYGEPTLNEAGEHMSIGQNAYMLTTLANGMMSYNVMASMDDTGKTYPLACSQTQQTVMGRDSIVRETNFAGYKTGKKEDFNEEHKLEYYDQGKVPVSELDMWEKHPVENIGHRWGMSIDLNTCIGCGNCLVACVAENNVPVVGKDEMRRGRDMFWLRLDRYYSSDMTKEKAAEDGTGVISMYGQMEIASENPEVVFMPMMCQHCNHAPCETVCPVAATTHSNEGLNQMAYNRCIGTRYCANNCPYKVRRFNWFNYPTYKKFTGFNPSQDETMRMVLNPDVVVRTRGVMEKCSLCVQRIQAGKLEAKKAGTKVMSGSIQTACSEACSTGAIIFGDWNDTESDLRKSADSDRSYRALEEIGIQPNIWYKVKVRNIAGEVKKEEKTEH